MGRDVLSTSKIDQLVVENWHIDATVNDPH